MGNVNVLIFNPGSEEMEKEATVFSYHVAKDTTSIFPRETGQSEEFLIPT